MMICMCLDTVVFFSLDDNVGYHLFLRNMFKSFFRDPLRMKNMVAVDPERGHGGSLWLPM